MLSSGQRFCILLSLLGSLTRGLADNGWEGQLLSFNLENDAVAHSDRHYTQGARISYFTRDNSMPDWIKEFSSCLPGLGLDIQAQKIGLALGQEIYTPDNLRPSGVIADDRPYAGWLYGSLTLQRRGEISGAWLAMESFRLDLGMVGPESFAEKTQKEFHGIDPAGWSHQLETEPGLALRYDRRFLFSLENAQGWGLDFLPHINMSLGNIATFLGAGMTFRFGHNIPNEFEVPAAETRPKYGFYLLGGVEGRWVLHSIFLDGNSFRSSHSVDREPLVSDFKVGCTFVLKRVELNLAYVLRTPEFDGQDRKDSFGSATMTIKF